MMGTINCVYETPCGWCSKWDKKCNRKIPELEQRTKCNPVDESIPIATVNKMCRSESDHKWELAGITTAGDKYRCKICGASKTHLVNRAYPTTIATLNNSV